MPVFASVVTFILYVVVLAPTFVSVTVVVCSAAHSVDVGAVMVRVLPLRVPFWVHFGVAPAEILLKVTSKVFPPLCEGTVMVISFSVGDVHEVSP